MLIDERTDYFVVLVHTMKIRVPFREMLSVTALQQLQLTKPASCAPLCNRRAGCIAETDGLSKKKIFFGSVNNTATQRCVERVALRAQRCVRNAAGLPMNHPEVVPQAVNLLVRSKASKCPRD
jgi:hypothetical protein